MGLRLREIIAADLLADTGRTGFIYGLAQAILNPGFGTLLGYRVAAALYRSRFRLLGRLLWRVVVATSGAHISLRAQIGPGFKIPHPVGICIGNGAVIGSSVTVHQNVSIGRNILVDAYPVVGDGVTILANAVVAGKITIGARAIIGGGAVVLSDVPEDTIVSGNPARRVWVKDRAIG